MNTYKNKKIILGMLPYWDPLIPPQGAAYLKCYLQKFGYEVKAIDGNIESIFKNIYNEYFNLLKSTLPEYRYGNFYNVGHDVLQNHLMCHRKYKDVKAYIELVKVLIYKSYYVSVDESLILKLNSVLNTFYDSLEKYIIDLIEKEKPDVVGFTVYKGNLPATLFAFKLIKEKYPHIKNVMGGGVFADSHCVNSPNYEALLNEGKGYIDKILIGQGEILFLKYLEEKLPAKKLVCTREDIGGEILDFEDMEIPDLSDFKLENYPYLAATSSNSCPYECSFCNSAQFYGKYREKNPKQTINEMIKQSELYGRNLFLMTDSLLNYTIGNIAREIINRDALLYFDAYFRISKEIEDIEKVLLWRRGGFYRARIGVESGSKKVLDAMGKKITVEQIKKSIRNLAYAGIKTTAYIVIGHPGETEEDFQMTLDMLEELKEDIWQAECNPFAYHYDGQSNSDQWKDNRILLYPEDAKDMLVFESWTLNTEPLREEVYNRVSRFTEHCKRLGIPNPYSLHEIYEADERWKKLHANAVPSLIDIMNNKIDIEELELRKKLFIPSKKLEDSGEFNF